MVQTANSQVSGTTRIEAFGDLGLCLCYAVLFMPLKPNTFLLAWGSPLK